MEENPKPRSYFGRIVGANLAVVLLLHSARTLLPPDSGIFLILFALAFINAVMGMLFSSQGQSDNGFACLVSAFVIFLVGVSNCAQS
ncbi:hypothetical protein [Hymenobacter persicinus]|uniref:Uncharacterized protein n=1 Tax=Hymenobacter persicinus TaxID=2025506 RepID=A0A4Q5L9A1_9BACT|nr:hypothetical protein [Hymenobacter persicinus]RYU77207.1 hypothetical protein EWM57_17720 [Hymenobacter persicinus]